MNLQRLRSFLQFIKYLASRRLRFPRKRIHQDLVMEDGQTFTIFREAVVSPSSEPASPDGSRAVFRVRFHVAYMSPRQNVLFSLLPIPFFTGLPGFRHKVWMLNRQNGDFQGIYEWETAQDAENYAHSFAMRFMTRRSQPGSVSCEVIPNHTLDGYLASIAELPAYKVK